MQVKLSVKRVKGDPVKYYFQDHDKHLLKLYRGCRRLRFAKSLESLTAEQLQEDRDKVSGESLLAIQDRMTALFNSWETTDHKPSRVIALYIKDSVSYSRCQDWVRNLNYWMLEKESCDSMGHWKQL